MHPIPLRCVAGKPLNEAGERIVEAAKSGASAPVTADDKGEGVLDAIPAVSIAEGKWKYVQIELTAPGEAPKRVVRNTAGLLYHPDMYQAAMDELAHLDGVRGHVIGGGRIVFDPERKYVSIYGYSKTFGRAPGCNEESAAIVRRAMPGHQVEWSDEGY